MSTTEEPSLKNKPLRGQGISVSKAKKPGHYLAQVRTGANGAAKWSTVGTYPSYVQAVRAAKRSKRKQGGGLASKLQGRMESERSLEGSIWALDNSIQELIKVIKAM